MKFVKKRLPYISPIKRFFQIESAFFLRLGLLFLVLAALTYVLGKASLTEDLTVYAYFALVFGALVQIIEIRSGKDPVWIFWGWLAKIARFGRFPILQIGLLVTLIELALFSEIFFTPGILLDGVFGKLLIFYNQGPWRPFSLPLLVTIEKLLILFFFLLLGVGLVFLFNKVRSLFLDCKERLRPKRFIIPVPLNLFLMIFIGFLGIFLLLQIYAFINRYLLEINRFIAIKLLAREGYFNMVKITKLWLFLKNVGWGIYGLACLLFGYAFIRRTNRFSRRIILPMAHFPALGFGLLAVLTLAVFTHFLILPTLKLKPAKPLSSFVRIDELLPEGNFKVVWFPGSQKKEIFASAYLSKNPSFGITKQEKEAYRYLWWQIFHGKKTNLEDLLRQSKIRFLVYFKDQGTTVAERDLILKGLAQKVYLSAYDLHTDYVIYEYPDWYKGPSLVRDYYLDEQKEFEEAFGKPPILPVIGDVNPDLMRKEISGAEERIVVKTGKLAEHDWWLVGTRTFPVEPALKYWFLAEVKNEGVRNLHVYAILKGPKSDEEGRIGELERVLLFSVGSDETSWEKRTISFETTPLNTVAVEFFFYFKPQEKKITSWLIRRFVFLSADEFAQISAEEL